MLKVIGISLVLITAPGCSSMEPPYPASALTFDEGLVGTWTFVLPEPAAADEKKPDITLAIEARDIPIKDGRVDTDRIEPDGTIKRDAKGANAPAATGLTMKAYRMSLAADGKTTPLLAIMTKVDGRTIVGAQVAASRIKEVGLDGWVIPAHRVFSFDRDGDTLRCRGLKAEVAWIPGVRVLDGTNAGSETLASIAAEEHPTLRVSTSIDRLLDICRQAAGAPELWHDPPIVLRRTAP